LVTKASEGRFRSSNRLGQAPATRRREASEVEGTPGAVDCEPFREGAWKAALEGRSRFGGACRAGSFERGRNRTVAGSRNIPSVVRHELVTGGARVNQVGVNPPRQAVVAMGVERAKKPERPLA
jgi:hypothetical protein